MSKARWKKEYEKMLHNPDMSNEEVSNYLWENGYTPKYLYKYFAFDKKYWYKNMIQGEIFLNSADALNDPFDCLYQINIEKYLQYTISDFENSGREIDVGRNKYDIMKEISYKKLSEWADELQKRTRVTCFTEKYNSLLMWGHYTYKHQGFCVRYNLKKLSPKFRQLILPVVYCDQPYDMSKLICRPQVHNEHLYTTPFLYKYNTWAYEKEWRIILHEEVWKDVGNDLNSKKAIDKVYFGYRAPEMDYFSNAQKACRKSGIKMRRIIPVKNSYDLYSEKLK